MIAQRRAKSRAYGRDFIFACVLSVVLCSSYLFAAERKGSLQLPRYRIEALKHISAEQGEEYLADLEIGAVSQLPSPNTLLITAQPRQLIKASAILKLVDSDEQFVIKAIFPASAAKDLPSNKQIAAEIGDISIGTFSEPPDRTAKTRAIIDIHNDAVVAIAPASQFERIVSAIEQLQKSKAKVLQPAEPAETVEPNQPSESKAEEIVEPEVEKIVAQPEFQQAKTDANDSEKDELFGKLLGSLAEAEKRIAERKAEPLEALPEAELPIEPSVDSEQAEPTTYQPAEQPGEPNLAVVVKDTKAKDAAEEPEAEPEPEPAIEKVTAETIRSYEPKPIPIGEEMLELDLPERLNIIDLLGLMGKYLNLDYMYDPAKVKGEVTLKLQGPIKVKDLYPLLESVLKFRGFVMTRKGNLVIIVPAAEGIGIDPVIIGEDKGQVEYGDVIVTRIFDLKHVAPATASNLLAGLKLGININTSISETGKLIVTGYAHRMARIEELLQMIDKPGKPRQFRFRQLRYTLATALAPKIKTLAEQLGTVSISIAAPPAPKPGRRRRPAPKPAPTPKAAEPSVYLDADERTNRILMIGFEEQLAVVDGLIDALDVVQQDLRTLRLYDIQRVGAEEVKEKLAELGIIGGRRGVAPAPSKAKSAPAGAAGPLVEEPQVVIIESTNSLLVNATAEQHAQIAVIIGYVDSETLEEAIPYEIYSLENQDPENLAEVLQKLIQETVKDKKGKIEKVVKKQEDIVIVPDKNTFSIIVYASRKNQEWVGRLIKNLDKRRPQVLIDVTLVEISKTDAFQYDLDLVSSFPDLDQTGGLVGSITGTTTSAIMSALEAAWDRNRFIDASSKSGEGKGFYADEHIHALLTLMRQKDYGRVLAKPKILVNDNETGTINTENTTYVARTTESVTPAGQTVVETSVTFDAFMSGISLDITPHISEGDLLRLEISMSRSEQATAGGTDAPPPDKTENRINTIVTVPDNSTIILGGILQLDQDKRGSKVPILGDLPLLGGLFRDIDNSDIQSKLYIFVKANILRPSDTEKGLPDLERISKRNRFAFEESERELQEYQQWPGMDSEPMDPLRVLDTE